VSDGSLENSLKLSRSPQFLCKLDERFRFDIDKTFDLKWNGLEITFVS